VSAEIASTSLLDHVAETGFRASKRATVYWKRDTISAFNAAETYRRRVEPVRSARYAEDE